jgi:adenylate cyclase
VRGVLLDPKGSEVPLRAKSFELLRLFVTHAGRLLGRDTINQAIWSDVVVTDDAITQCVRDIRRALGDRQQRILKTIPRRGYVLAVEVAALATQRSHGLNSASSQAPDKPSIAVLPFSNLNGGLEQEYFSDGLADDVITELSRSRSLLVIARNSSFTYRGQTVDVKQVARELGVRYVLEGSVRRDAKRVRVNTQLIDARTGNHIWAERYDRALEDVLAVQNEITLAVAAAVLPAISSAEQKRILRKTPESLGAWEAYQRGLWHAGKGTALDNERARKFFRLAAELDPLFAGPHAMLAYSLNWDIASGEISPDRAAVEVAGTEARRAIELDPDDPIALAVLSWASLCDGNYAAGMERADRAISAAPSDPIAWHAKARVLLYSGKIAEARAAIQLTLQLDPHGPATCFAWNNIMISHYFERDYEATVEMAHRTIEIHPEFPLTYRWLAAALGQLGRTDEARNALNAAIAVSPSSFELYARKRAPWLRPVDYEHMLEGLRNAGWTG